MARQTKEQKRVEKAVESAFNKYSNNTLISWTFARYTAWVKLRLRQGKILMKL